MWGFEVLPRRWVVERTFAWLSQNRKMGKDYERLYSMGEAFVYAAMIRLMVRLFGARVFEVPLSFLRESLVGFSEYRSHALRPEMNRWVLAGDLL
jgi:hypothetical protein